MSQLDAHGRLVDFLASRTRPPDEGFIKYRGGDYRERLSCRKFGHVGCFFVSEAWTERGETSDETSPHRRKCQPEQHCPRHDTAEGPRVTQTTRLTCRSIDRFLCEN